MAKNTDLINKSHCKAFILKMAAEHRSGWPCSRVSQQVLDDLNYKLVHTIIGSVKRHPTIGKTFRELQ